MPTKVAIIGAGAAGSMAAISIKKHHPEMDVFLFEKNQVLGKKILICGAGRCNVTNSNVTAERFYGGHGQFIPTILKQFGGKDIQKFLNDLGIELYEEHKNGRRKGKIFPITNQAKTVTELLQNELERLGINLILGAEITNIQKTANFKLDVRINDGETKILDFDRVILASGGKTYPRLGATGFGFDIAKKFGHKIIDPVPSALPLKINHRILPKVEGQKLMAEVKSYVGGELVKIDIDEVMFTKYGLSGPAILNISREISVAINRQSEKRCEVQINFLPGKNYEDVVQFMEQRWTARPDQVVRYSLYGVFPNKVVDAIMWHLDIPPQKTNVQLSKEQKNKITMFLSQFRLVVDGTKGWEDAEFTAGGVDTKEIKNTLESKIVPGLYFAGEVMNVDGDVGGFNLSWAWSSGWSAGKLS